MYYYYKGQWRTLTDMQSIASAEDLSVDDFVKKYSIKIKNEKPKTRPFNVSLYEMGQTNFSPITTNLDQPIKKPRPDYQKASDLIDKTKELGIYSFDLYGKDEFETISNAERAINDYQSGSGNYIWSEQNANATPEELAIWYGHHKKRCERVCLQENYN